MDGSDRPCRHRDCEDNRDGYCGHESLMALGWAAAAFPATGAMMGNIAPVVPPFGLMGAAEEGELSGFGQWDSERDCPRREEKDLKE